MYLKKQLSKVCEYRINAFRIECTIEQYLKQKLYAFSGINPKSVEVGTANTTESADVYITIEYKKSFSDFSGVEQGKIKKAINLCFRKLKEHSNIIDYSIIPSENITVEFTYFMED